MGGIPASLVDSTSIIAHYLPSAVLLVVGATFLILLLLFRSVFIPVKALVLSMVSLSATFGVMVWIFQEGHLSRLLDFTPTGTLIDTMPILMFCVAFGLSMDYEVFLVSRMKEFHDNGMDNDAAIAGGMQQTGRIITAAALLMSIIFLSLLTSSDLLHQALRRRARPGGADGRLRHSGHVGPRHHEAGRQRQLVGSPLHAQGGTAPTPDPALRRARRAARQWVDGRSSPRIYAPEN